MSEPRNCIVMRRQGDSLSTHGPMAHPVTAAEALEEARTLARRYPHQQFVVMGQVSSVETQHRLEVTGPAPSGAIPFRAPRP